ncbi:DNA mismatch repair endonuclease MutL [Acutalibacter sp. 1XD8-36]|uniref:DNA mismatch repair endonuclease MutL n=1 Tax=Acutalibacter sp. 1XD8-36 TaxID=2320852 RepID=UPI0014129FD0|nr:DNA mismatch repair endonuclease MutL [Acutalibacter sp. 1XD8-36]NBJ88054.1 DNA mismatch repair endonuclease MutL [Acutalibacter sp. 1XD8-36]
MPRIHVLEKQVAELIAAGEVVERPSAVIKELVENSVDAGATVITVEIRRGGVTYMRVTDNGCGISAEDVPVAFLRHATSKVSGQEDLDAIGTLGFRGEALASISAVSHVELFTRAEGQEVGVRYACGGDEEPLLTEAGCPQGTTIVVRDLFFNTPARMKFLKKDVTEGNSVAGILDKLAMSHPEISIRFIRDGREQLHSPGDNKLSSAVYAVCGKEFSSTLIPVDYLLGHVKVHGFISTPAGCRPNRSMQNFFINGRFIRSRTAMAALEEAYKGSVMAGKFPACVLHMQVACEAVDVNVHPAKLEVRFVNERPIFDAVYHGVRSALNAGDRPKIMELKKPSPYAPVLEKKEQLTLDKPGSSNQPLFLHDSGAQKPKEPELPKVIKQALDTVPKPVFKPNQPNLDTAPPQKAVPKPALVQESKLVMTQMPEPEKPPEEKPRQIVSDFSSRILGEAFGTYIIVEYSKDQLMFIDKHAAHERLLYERLKASRSGCEAQALLEPVTVNLDMEEYTAVIAHEQELSRAGFEVSDFGAGTVLVRTAPMLLDGQDAALAVMEIAGYLASFKTEITTEHMDWVYHNVACRAAIKAGDHTSRQELISLAVKLEHNPQVRYCPHGRPVYILLGRREIEKQFGRV